MLGTEVFIKGVYFFANCTVFFLHQRKLRIRQIKILRKKKKKRFPAVCPKKAMSGMYFNNVPQPDVN